MGVMSFRKGQIKTLYLLKTLSVFGDDSVVVA